MGLDGGVFSDLEVGVADGDSDVPSGVSMSVSVDALMGCGL